MRHQFQKVYNIYVVSNSPVQSDDEGQQKIKELYETDGSESVKSTGEFYPKFE